MDPLFGFMFVGLIVFGVALTVVLTVLGVDSPSPSGSSYGKRSPSPGEYREAIYLASLDVERRNNYLNPISRDR